MNKRIILVGKTCAGKSYIREKFREKGYQIDVSYTSRPPREGEVDGIDYHFISADEFIDMLADLKFYEYVKYNDNWYGTGEYEFRNSEVFIMETEGVSKLGIDRQDSLVIYVNTPLETRAKRMKERGWSDEKIQERIEEDNKKFKNFKDYDLEIDSEVSDEHYFFAYEGNTEIERCTCHTCLSNKTCEFAYDPYNTDGDCLAMK